MIWDGFFAHCFAECLIFLCLSKHFGWIFLSLFCRMRHFSGFHMIWDGVFVHCFAECLFCPRISYAFSWICWYTLGQNFTNFRIFIWCQMDFSYTVLQTSALFLGLGDDIRWIFHTRWGRILICPGFLNALTWICRTLCGRMRHFLWFANNLKWICRTLFGRLPHFKQAAQLILGESFVHCFAECSIFLSFSYDFRWVFRTLRCGMIIIYKNFKWF